MEENLLNELENFASIKYLDNVTNSSSTNNCCSDDDQDNSLFRQLAIKDRQLVLAAKCGKVLLEQKEELERQLDNANRDSQQRIDELEQERHELRLFLEQIQAEWQMKMFESNEDKTILRRQLDELRREHRMELERHSQIIQELSENNLKLSQDLHSSRTSESRLQEQLKILRQQTEINFQIHVEQTNELNLLKQQFSNLHSQHMQLELDHHLLVDERDTIAHRLDECQRKCISIEDECRSLQETKFQNEKELNDAHELIHRLSQCAPETRVSVSFLEELQQDLHSYPMENRPLYSTVIDEENENCSMNDDDGVEVSAMRSSSQANEKCLLDELLQTEEFKREIVLVYKQLRSLCMELIHLHSNSYSNTSSASSSSISESVDKVYDRLQNGCLISILFELKNLIKDRIEKEEMPNYDDQTHLIATCKTMMPSPSLATINSYTSAYDDINLLMFSSPPPV